MIILEDLTHIRERIKANLRVRVRLHRWPFRELQQMIVYNDDVTRSRAAAVNDEKVTVADPGFRHGFAAGADGEGRGMRAFQLGETVRLLGITIGNPVMTPEESDLFADLMPL